MVGTGPLRFSASSLPCSCWLGRGHVKVWVGMGLLATVLLTMPPSSSISNSNTSSALPPPLSSLLLTPGVSSSPSSMASLSRMPSWMAGTEVDWEVRRCADDAVRSDPAVLPPDEAVSILSARASASAGGRAPPFMWCHCGGGSSCTATWSKSTPLFCAAPFTRMSEVKPGTVTKAWLRSFGLTRSVATNTVPADTPAST
mmetsp:Transcript_12418/g.37337  ORF Transcript_12418/g.37337 Transcript_12418/m.37337 type:complete len:200 (-) Transcript_12418:581-1180(-)